MRSLYFLDGTYFANDFVRVVHGARGKYIELSRDQIQVDLVSKYGHPLPVSVPNGESFYYYWLVPVDRSEKIYWQARTVTYADYKIGFYYISPKLSRI
jgi:hypothetical protein